MRFFNKMKKNYTVSEAYKNESDFSKKSKYWEEHAKDLNYDPMYDFRHVSKDKKKKWSIFRRKKVKKKDEFEEGLNRVRNIINR